VPEGEHLLAREHHPHRALQVQRRHHRQQQLVLRPQAGAEGAADEGIAHGELLGLEAEHLAHRLLAVHRALGLVVDR
jgi:hypothetical protein